MIIDIIVLVLACVVLLGLVWLSEQVKDWIWGRVFAIFKFLFKTVLGMGLFVFVVAFVSYLILNGLFSTDPILDAAQQAQGQVEPPRQFPYWLQVVIYGLAGLTLTSLFISGYRRLTGSNREELAVVPDPGPEVEFEEEDPSVFSWGRFVTVVGGSMLLINISVRGVSYALGGPTVDWPIWFMVLNTVVSAFLGILLWLYYEMWWDRRRERLQQEREQATARARLEENRLARLAEAAEAERLIPDEDPPTHPGPRDPASGGPAHSPASRVAPPPAPGYSRPMPPPSFGRPTARPAEEDDMDIHHAPPPPAAPRRRLPPVDHTGTGRRQADGGQPQGGWRNWPWYVWAVGATVLVALIGGGVYAYSNRDPSEEDLLVERAVQMQAEETLRTYMVTDSVMSKSCPNGWNDDCWRTLYAAKIELPPCVQVEQSQVNTTGVSSWVAMDDRCRAEMVRQNGRRVKEAAAKPTGEVRMFLENTEFSQRRAFQTGDTARINALLDDPALKREVILDFWMDSNVPWSVLAHPSLNQGDLTKIYGVVQANGWYKAMPWLVINPNLSPDLRGMWLTRPVADPVERERLILLGMHQPAVSAGAFSWLVGQALDEVKEGKPELWKILLKAGENGDLRVDKCHLKDEQDKDRKEFPLCKEGQTWDTVGQMEQAQAKDSTLPSPSIGWTELRSRCGFESLAGRHSKAAKASEERVIRTLADASPSNLPPEP